MDSVAACCERWSLTPGEPFESDGATSSWVAPVVLADGSPAVLKLGMPHMEGEHEIQGLRFWDGDPTVRLLAADEESNAMLIERCLPGTSLRDLPEPEQDLVIAQLLRRLWRMPPASHPFRPLSEMIAYWSAEALARTDRWPDMGLVCEGLRVFEKLAQPSSGDVLLATDLHAGNVLRSEREPWLVIDPKPFIGDPAFDVTQHLLNCKTRLRRDPKGLVNRIAELLELDRERVGFWTFARLATTERCADIANAIAP